MIKHFSKKLLIALVCCLLGLSTGYAQDPSHYLNGNSAVKVPSFSFTSTPVQIQVPYKGGNGKEAAGDCKLGIFLSIKQVRDACFGDGVGGAQFGVAVVDGGTGGDYKFWWPSKGSKDSPACTVTNPGAGTFTVPSGNRPDGPAADDEWLYVALGEVVDSVYIGGNMGVLDELKAGTFTSSASSACYNTTESLGLTYTGAEPTGGDGTYTYEWRVDDGSGTVVAIGSTNSLSYTVPSTYTEQHADYVFTHWVKDGACSDWKQTGGSYTLHIYKFEKGAIKTDNQTVCVGGTPGLIGSETDAKGGDITYQWYRNGIAIVDDATNATYLPPVADTEVSGAISYTRKAIDQKCGDAEFSAGEWVLAITANDPIDVVADPASVNYNGSVSLTADDISGASGITYTWSTSIDGGANWTLLDGNAKNNTAANLTAVAHYFKASAVTDKGCISPSGDWAVVEVRRQLDGGAITAGAATVCAGATVNTVLSSTTVPSGGSGDYNYIWEINGAATTVTTASYSLGSYTAGEYTFKRKVKDNVTGAEAVSDGEYVLTVTAAPALTITAPSTYCYDVPAGNLEVTNVVGAIYTWEKSEAGSGLWATIQVQTNTYNPGRLLATTIYRVTATLPNGCEGVVSTTINVRPEFTPGAIESTTLFICPSTQLADLQIPSTKDASGGDSNDGYAYSWRKNTGWPYTLGASINKGDFSIFGNITEVVGTWTRSASNTTLGLSPVSNCAPAAQPSEGSYVIQMLTQEGSDTLKIDITPSYKETYRNAEVTLAATNVAGATYTWYVSKTGKDSDWQKIDDANAYTYAATVTHSPAYYRAEAEVATTANCFRNSTQVPSGTAATITFPAEKFSPGSITAGAQTICAGIPINSTVITGTIPSGGAGNYQYQWKLGDKYIPGAEDVKYIPSTEHVFAAGVYKFTRWVTDASGEELQSEGEYTLTVVDQPKITLTASSNEPRCYGASIELTATDVPGADYTWEEKAGSGWLLHEVTPGNTRTFSDLSRTTDYRVRVSQSGGCEAIGEITVTVHDKIDAGAIPTTTYIACEGSDPQTIGSVRNASGGSGNITYRWYRNGTEIFGAKEATYTPQPSDFAATGTVVYTRAAVDLVCSTPVDATGAYTVEVRANMPNSIELTAVPNPVQKGENVTLLATNIAGATYSWKQVMPAEEPVDGTTFSTVELVDWDGARVYQATATLNGCDYDNTIYTKQVLVETLSAPLNGGELSSGTTICVGTTGTYRVAALPNADGGVPTYRYLWYVNGVFEKETTVNEYEIAAKYINTPGEYVITRKVIDAHDVEDDTDGNYTLTVLPKAEIGRVEYPINPVCQGTAVTLRVDDDLQTATYKWEKKSASSGYWEVETSSTSNVLSMTGLTESTTFRVSVLENSACSYSDPSSDMMVVVYDAFKPGAIESTEMLICEGAELQPVQSITAATGGNPSVGYTYRWYKNGSMMYDEGTGEFIDTPELLITTDMVDDNAPASFTRRVRNITCNPSYTPSEGVYVLRKVSDATEIDFIVTPDSVRTHETFTVELTATNIAGAVYEWEYSSDNVDWHPLGDQYRITSQPATAAPMYYRASATVTTTGGACANRTFSSASAPSTVTAYAVAFNAGAIKNGSESICIDGVLPAIGQETAPSGGKLGDYQYEWRVNNRVIQGATQATLSPSTAYMSEGANSFTRRVTNDGSALWSEGEFVITLMTQPRITSIMGAAAVCYGASTDVWVAASSDVTTYKWEYDNGINWFPVTTGGGDAATCTTGPLTLNTTYRVTVSNGVCASLTRVGPTITVSDQLKGGAIDNSIYYVCDTDFSHMQMIASLQPATGGEGPISYLWYRNGDPISGANNATYQPEEAGSYTRVAVDNGCADAQAPSAGTYVVVVTPDGGAIPSITLTADPEKVHPNETTSLQATNIFGATYAWVARTALGVTPLPNTEHYYTARITTPTTFTVTVTVPNSDCTSDAMSSTATKFVDMYGSGDNPQLYAGAITTNDITICAETPVTVEEVAGDGAAGGDGTYTYNWYINGVPVFSSTATDYTVDNLYINTPGVYAVTREVTDNSNGAKWSTGTYTFRVIPKLNINGTINSNVAATVCIGTPATLTVNMTGAMPITIYSWEQSVDDGANWTSVPGASGTMTAVTLTEKTMFKFTALNGDCDPAVVELTIDVYPAFDAGSVDNKTVTVCKDGDVDPIGTDASGGSETPTYQWYKNGEKLEGDTDSKLTPSTSETGTSSYTRQVFSACSNDWVDSPGTYVLKVITQPEVTITYAPDDMIVVNSSATITATVGTEGAYTYTWKHNSADLANDMPAGADYVQNDNTLAVSGITATGTHTYELSIASDIVGCSALTATADLIVVDEPVVIVTPMTLQVENGVSDKLTASTTNSVGTVTYEWQYSYNGSTYWEPIADGLPAGVTYTYSEADNSVITFSSDVENATTAYYRAVAKDDRLTSYGTFTHTTAAEVKFILPAVGGQAVLVENTDLSAKSICEGTAVHLTLSGHTGRVSKWQSSRNGEDWVDIPNSNSINYTFTSSLPEHKGKWYFRAELWGTVSFKPSAAATITVNPAPAAGLIQNPQGSGSVYTICEGTSNEVTVTNTEGTISWQWKKSGEADEAYQTWTAATHTTATISISSAGTYVFRVKAVSESCDPVYSVTPLAVVVREAMDDITLSLYGQSPTSTIVCAGAEVVLVSSKSLANGTATWQQRTGTEWETATGGNPMGNYYYSVTNTVPATYFYRLKYEDMCGTEYSNNEIQVTYLDAVDGGTVTATVAELCVDASATLKHEMETFRDPANTYTWERRRDMTAWVNLGSTADTYEVTNTAGNDGEWLYRIKVEGSGTPDFGICNVSYSPAYKIVLHPVPTVTLSSGLAEETVCDGYKVDITLTGTPNTKYFMERSVDGNAEGLREVTEISEILNYVGDGNSPQTVTYKVTPKINDCAGDTVPKTYYLWPSLTLDIDQAESVLALNCKGAEDGAIVLTAQPSAMAYTFTLYNVATGQVVAENATGSFTGLSAGVYRITASNSVSCSAETTATITEPETHVTIDNATVTNVLCNGGSDGAIELSISGGVAPYLVSLNGAAYTTNTSYSDLFAGTYVFTVKDANECTTTVTAEVTQPDKLGATILQVTGVSAPGAGDATVTLEATGGAGGYLYSATGAPNNFSISGALIGLYEGTNYVHVKDANQCAIQLPVVISEYSGTITQVLSASAMVTHGLTCTEASDAQITVTILNGTGPYWYSLDNGASWGGIISGSIIPMGFSAGVHTILVRDQLDKRVSIDVTVDPVVSMSLTAEIITPANMAGENAAVQLTARGGSGAYQYQLNGGSWVDNVLFSQLSAGTHAFRANDKNNAVCQSPEVMVAIAAATSDDPLVPGITLMASVKKEEICPGSNNGEIAVSATGGTAPYTFTITGGTPAVNVTEAVFAGLAPGTYEVQATNAAATSTVLTLTIAEPAPAPVINDIAVVPASCGNNNAKITVSATGNNLQYSVNGGRWTPSAVFDNLSAGYYNVLVKDPRGCLTSSTVNVTMADPLEFRIEGVTGTSSYGSADGSVSVSASGGQVPYLFTLIDVTAITAPSTDIVTFNNLRAGRYVITASESGCTTTISRQVQIGDGPAQLSAHYATKDLLCAGDPTGEIVMTVTGGSGSYTYSLDGNVFGTSNSFTGLAAGTYSLYAKDNSTPVNSITIDNVVINSPKQLEVTASMIRNLSGPGARDAEIQLSATGGTAPYSYMFNNSENETGMFTTGAGTYSIQAKDNNGCIATGTIKVNDIGGGDDPVVLPTVTAMVAQQPTCFGASDGVISVSASGGRAPYSFSINQLNWYSGGMITGVAAGTYTVYVKELSLNRITEGPEVVVVAPEKLALSAAVEPVTTAGGADGKIILTAAGGVAPYNYSMNDGVNYQMSNEFAGLAANHYNLMVKDRNGCTAVAGVVLADPDKITFTAEVTTPVTCYGGNDGVVTITASGNYQYSSDMNRAAWLSNPVLTGFTGGWHMVYVRDAADITLSDSLSIFVDQPTQLVAIVNVMQHPTNGQSNGIIGIIASGGSGNYTYHISGGTCSSIIENLPAGDYAIEVRDAAGCNTATSLKLSSVGIVSNVTQLNILKGKTATYTLRLTSQPAGDVTVSTQAVDPNLITVSPAQLTFTESDWNVAQPVVVTALVADNNGVPGYRGEKNTIIKNGVTAATDTRYIGIACELIVTVTDDGSKDCSDYETNRMTFALDNEPIDTELYLCSDKAPYTLKAQKSDAVSYRFWRNGILLASSGDNIQLTEGGTYTVMATNNVGCFVTESILVTWEVMPAVPQITGAKSSKPGVEQTYKIVQPAQYLNYTWTLPRGYSFVTNSYNTDPEITIITGTVTASLQLEVKNRNGFCNAVNVSYPVEIVTAPDVNLYPTVITGDEPITIVAKDMVIENVSAVNTIGVPFPVRIMAGSGLPAQPDEPIQISLGNINGGHYFIVIYGTKGESVVKQIVKD